MLSFLTTVERLTVKAFITADKDSDGEISKYEFDQFCFSHPMCKDFLDYWCGNVNQVVLADKENFIDTSFPPIAASLYENISTPPSGMVPASTVEWLRPSHFCPDSPTLFSDGPLANTFRPGSSANKWFISALNIVASNFSLIQNIFVHTGQESHGRYCCKFFKEVSPFPRFDEELSHVTYFRLRFFSLIPFFLRLARCRETG